MNWLSSTATDQCAALKKRQISATELLELTIERSESVSESLNPFALKLYDRARKRADTADKKLRKGKGGKLCGLPITVKDSQWLAGVRCANGSPSLADFVPEQTCTAISQLELEDAVIFAKTTCPELCLSGTGNSPLYGPTVNPWDLTRTPGGSSSGAAAAVASGCGSLAFGSDGGGSIRIPAAFCGIVGFKPSYGVVTRRPGFTTWESLVAYGPMCRSVRDAELMFSVVLNRDAKLSRGGAGTKIIASEDLGFAPVNDEIRVAFRQLIESLQQNDIQVALDNPGLQSSVVSWAALATHDMWEHKGNTKSEKYKEPGPLQDYANSFIQFGSTFSELEIADANAYRRVIDQAYTTMFDRQRCNILITPTLGCEAFSSQLGHPLMIEGREITYPWLDWAGMLYDANLTGMPACSIPMGTGRNGLPIGLQVTGPQGSDLQVLEIARKIEEVIDWQYPTAPAFSVDLVPAPEESLLLPVDQHLQHPVSLGGLPRT